MKAASAGLAMPRSRWCHSLAAFALGAGLATARASQLVDIESDVRFTRVVAEEGMKHPRNFRFGGMYMTSEPDASKKVVLFVHGVNGSPRDFLEVPKHIDLSKYQPWFAYYATGDSVAASGNAIAANMEALMKKHGISRLSVFAHSLGGIVAWQALEKLGPGFGVSRLVSVNTSWGGNFAARLGSWLAPSPPAMWSDLAPDSEALLHIRNNSVKRPFTLVYIVTRDDPRASGDGTVIRRSQLQAGMRQREASGLSRAYSSHSSISVTPGRLSSWWMSAKSGARWWLDRGTAGRNNRASISSSLRVWAWSQSTPAARASETYLPTTLLEILSARPTSF